MEDSMEFRLISQYTYRYEPIELLHIGFTILITALFAWLYIPCIWLAVPLGYLGSWLTLNYVRLEYFLMYLERKRKFFAFAKKYAMYELKSAWVYFTLFFVVITVAVLLVTDKDSALQLSKAETIGLVIGAGTLVYVADFVGQRFIYRSAKRNELDRLGI